MSSRHTFRRRCRAVVAAVGLVAAAPAPAGAAYPVHDSGNLIENAATVSELASILAQAVIDASVSALTQEATGLPGPLGGLVRSPAIARLIPMGAASTAAVTGIAGGGYGGSAGLPGLGATGIAAVGIPGLAGDMTALGVDTTGPGAVQGVLSLVAGTSYRYSDAGAGGLSAFEVGLREGSLGGGNSETGAVIQALLPLADKLLGRGVGGQSTVLGGMVPTVGGPWQGAGGHSVLATPGTAVAYSRGVYALPATMRGQVGAPLASQLNRVRQDELANAIHDAHGAALFSLENVARHGAARIEDAGEAAMEAENLRTQVAVLTSAVLQLTEEVQGLRALTAAQLRLDAARAMVDRGADANGLLVSSPAAP